MKRACLFLLAAAAALPAQQLTKWERKHNTFHLQFSNSTGAELEFVSPSTFRMRRGLAGPARKPLAEALTECKATMEAAGLRLVTDDLTIVLTRTGGLLQVQLPAGLRIYSEAAVQVADGNATLELDVPPLEKFYGLGARPQTVPDAHGLQITPATPFFVTSQGYAFWMATSGPFDFDMGKTRPNRVRMSSTGTERLEYYFTFGPSMKEIWEERAKIEGVFQPPAPKEMELIPGPRVPRGAVKLPLTDRAGQELLCGEAAALVHASLSGVLMPAFDLSRYRAADDSVFRRAARLGTFAPIFYDATTLPYEGTKAAIAEEARVFRKRLSHFLVTYADETRVRGYPVIHPLLHQFPRDPEAGRHIGAFMLGDEFLIVPVCDGSAKREAYLPMGNWTDWHSGQEYRGRRTVTLDVPPDGIVVLVKNGALVPLSGIQPKDPTELHYFPKIGGEFFIYEPEAADYTQAHAGPAADIYRVEMESKVDRGYEWVMHHFDKPKTVRQVDANPYEETTQPGPVPPGKWRYDAGDRSLHIGIHAPAHSDIIVNIGF